MSRSRLAQALVLGALLAATNLVGMTGIAHATGGAAVLQDDRRPPTQGQVGESGTSAKPRPTNRLSAATRDGHPLKARSASPGIPGYTRPLRQPSRTASPGGRSHRWPCVGRRAGAGRRPCRQPSKSENANRARGLTTVTVTPPDGAAAPTRQPHHLASDELVLSSLSAAACPIRALVGPKRKNALLDLNGRE